MYYILLLLLNSRFAVMNFQNIIILYSYRSIVHNPFIGLSTSIVCIITIIITIVWVLCKVISCASPKAHHIIWLIIIPFRYAKSSDGCDIRPSSGSRSGPAADRRVIRGPRANQFPLIDTTSFPLYDKKRIVLELG